MKKYFFFLGLVLLSGCATTITNPIPENVRKQFDLIKTSVVWQEQESQQTEDVIKKEFEEYLQAALTEKFVNPAGNQPIESVVSITRLTLFNSAAASIITGSVDSVTFNVAYYKTKNNIRGDLIGEINDVTVSLQEPQGIMGALYKATREEEEKRLAEAMAEKLSALVNQK